MKFSDIINDQQLATEAVRRWTTTAVCIAIALLTATWIASGKFFLLTLLAGVAVVAFVTVGMQRNAWVLILIGWSFKGYIHALPLPMATCDVIILVVLFAYIAQRVVGQATHRPKGVLGAILGINCLYLAATLVVHPVGFHATGAETMGGRAYFNIMIAVCAYWVLVHMPESYKGVSRIPLWLLIGTTVSTGVSTLVYIFPGATPYVWFFYSDVDITGYVYGVLNPTAAGPEVRRFNTLSPFGLILIQVLAAYYPPSKFLNPGRWQFYLTMLGFAAILASGFRNTLAFALGSIVLVAWFHRGWHEVILGGLLSVILLGFLCYGQGRLFELPLPAQRTLGSLPGQWDEEVRAEIKTSNARYQWWQQLLQEGFVKNWWIGDGFGVSEADFNLMGSGLMTFTEGAMVTGGFHSGPLTTIRYVGLLGMALFYTLMIASAVYSVKLVGRCQGTPLFPAAIFLAIQLCWTPIHFTFLFGAYDKELAEQVFQIGLLTLIWHMSERQPPSLAPAARPLSRNNRATPVFP
jgi:hypothetical protein